MELYNQVLACTSQLLTKTNSKRHNRVLCEISACLTCLALGAKPSFLYDYGTISSDIALKLARLLAEDLQIFEDIIVVEFAQEIIFTRLSLLLQHLQNGDVAFIDVGNDPLKSVAMRDHLNHILQICQVWQTTPGTTMRAQTFKIPDDGQFSGPAIIGLLLGYPVVYYLRGDLNYLDNRQLLVIKRSVSIGLSNLSVCSFSVPLDCASSEINTLVAKWKKKFKEAFLRSDITIGTEESVQSFPALTL